MSKCRETVLMLVAALALLGCDATAKPVAYGETSITTNSDRNQIELNNLALSVTREVREGKPSARYVLEWRLVPSP